MQVSIFVSGITGSFIPFFLVIGLLFSIFQSFNQNIVRAEHKGMLYSVVNVSKAVTNLIFPLFFVLVFRTISYKVLVVSSILSVIVGFVVGFRVGYEYWIKPIVDAKQIKMLFTYSFPLVFEFVAGHIMMFTDRFMLRFLSNFSELGKYSASYKLVSISSTMTAGFVYFWRPYILNLSHEDVKKTKVVVKKMLNVVTAVTIPFTPVMLLFKDLIALLLGAQYREAKYIFPLLLSLAVYDLSRAVLIRAVEFPKKTKWAAVVNIIGALANVFGNWLFIPIFGAKGAALSTGFSLLIVLIRCGFTKVIPCRV